MCSIDVRVLPLGVPVVLRLAEAGHVVVGIPEGQDPETTLALSRLVLRPHELRTVAAALRHPCARDGRP